MPASPTRVLERDVPMTTRDGVTLRAVVHRIEDRTDQPVVLVRNPYGEDLVRTLPYDAFLDAGFAVVVQDCRGCATSDGDFAPFEHEEQDTLDAIGWCAALPYGNGTVATYGMSYLGMTQLAAAVDAPAELAAIVPIVTPADYHTGVAYRGGAMQLGQLTGWYTMTSAMALQRRAARGEDVGEQLARFAAHAADPWASVAEGPLADAPVVSEVLPTWRRWLAEETWGDYWSRVGYRDRRSAIAVPGLHVGGWFDLFLGGTLDNFTTLSGSAATERARRGQRLIVGPWSHRDRDGVVGERDFGPSASEEGFGLTAAVTRFLTAAVAGERIPDAPVRIFVMGADEWRDEQEWPLARTAYTPWYLHAGGALSPVEPARSEPSTYVHDPSDPVPMRGGQSGIFAGGLEGGDEWTPGPRDQRPLDDRADLLRFVSEPLADDVEVTGPVRVVLHAATSADDTDFVARLVDVWPDGRAMSVVDGIVRAKYRDGQDRARPITPGEVTRYEIDLWGTSQLFRAGHRIRVDIASSSYPNWSVNSGALVDVGRAIAADNRPAHQQVFHDPAHASHILLPVIPPAE
ncbi:CocE/NonD family hydrolase [Nocardioides sp. DS6]|uniref:CocE/NonD family hydrolase n=1 Tax=Nocardioides eburneus TaxID=3231482 RepID=A0ABV3T169_9ACTN